MTENGHGDTQRCMKSLFNYELWSNRKRHSLIQEVTHRVTLKDCEQLFSTNLSRTVSQNFSCIGSPEDGDSVFLRNVGIYLLTYTASQPRKRKLLYLPPLEPQIFAFVLISEKLFGRNLLPETTVHAAGFP